MSCEYSLLRVWPWFSAALWRVNYCTVEMTVTSKTARRHVFRCQQVDSGCLGQETSLFYEALRQLTELLKKLHPEVN